MIILFFFIIALMKSIQFTTIQYFNHSQYIFRSSFITILYPDIY